MAAAVGNRQRRVRVSTSRLRATAEVALSALGRDDRDVHVSVVDDPTIRRLNARYLRRRTTTDVLAFDLEAGFHAPGPSRLMGEVIVCADTARRQAKRVGVSVALELDLLLVHGLLHLAGWDDHEPREARLMHEREREILAEAGRRAPSRLWNGLLEPR
jgi:probable rRNA maturation factor